MVSLIFTAHLVRTLVIYSLLVPRSVDSSTNVVMSFGLKDDTNNIIFASHYHCGTYSKIKKHFFQTEQQGLKLDQLLIQKKQN